MKKFLFILFGVFVIAGAFAAGENIPTSKSYVDSKLGEKQDIIPANDGAARVLINTGTAGEYGTKGIYDSTGEYASQTQNLVDAATMNAGVQNAIDSEFQCIEYDENNECLLMQLGGITQVPAGYTQLEYIESTGTQWIDTGYILQSNSVIYEWRAKDESSDSTSLFGAEAANRNDYSGVLYGSKTKRTAWIGNSRGINIGYESDDDLFHTWKFTILDNNMFLQKDGIIGVSKSFNGILQNGLKLALFTNNIAGHYSSQESSVLLSYFKIYDNNSLARDMVPARRDSDGEIGMYDTVTNTFFTNSGTGEFIAGPVVNLYLPSGN